MGGMLTQPVTEKWTEQGEGLGLRYGVSTMQGWRPEMEDTHDIKIGLEHGLDDWSFFAVFDGHAGKLASAFSAFNLLEFILKDSHFKLGANEPIRTRYVGLNGEARDDPVSVEEECGLENDSEICEFLKRQRQSSQVTSAETNEITGEHENRSDKVNTTSNDITDQSKQDDEVKATTESKFASFSPREQWEMVKDSIVSGFLKMDQTMRETGRVDMSGCTAVSALISPTNIFVANCGDSRAVLCGKASKYPTMETQDHKPYNPKERKRIIEAGGTATQRINGTLAVSRALGDFEFKKDGRRGQCEQLVSPEPDVFVVPRDQDKDEFLILACDGIWDVITSDDLIAFVRHKLRIEPSVEKVCQLVLDLCLRKGSRDNMSIIIILFEAAPKVEQEAIEEEEKGNEFFLKSVENFYEKNPTQDFGAFFNSYKIEMENLILTEELTEPCGGLEAKYDLIRDKFDKLNEQTPATKPSSE